MATWSWLPTAWQCPLRGAVNARTGPIRTPHPRPLFGDSVMSHGWDRERDRHPPPPPRASRLPPGLLSLGASSMASSSRVLLGPPASCSRARCTPLPAPGAQPSTLRGAAAIRSAAVSGVLTPTASCTNGSRERSWPTGTRVASEPPAVTPGSAGWIPPASGTPPCPQQPEHPSHSFSRSLTPPLPSSPQPQLPSHHSPRPPSPLLLSGQGSQSCFAPRPVGRPQG